MKSQAIAKQCQPPIAIEGENATAHQSVLAAAKQWSERLASGAAEETRTFVRKLVPRMIVRTASIDVLVDRNTLRSALLGSPAFPKANLPDDFLRLKVKGRLKRCGREVRLVLPANSETRLRPVPSLIKAVARAHSWCDRIVRGELAGTRSIAKATGLDERYVSRIFQCAFLAPDIVESILDGRPMDQMTLENLRAHLPVEWEAQRQLLGPRARPRTD